MKMMQQTMRWYGPKDPVSLQDIRQAGASGIVTALHEIPNGEVWSRQAIRERKNLIENAGLNWAVVESVPVHEKIKTRTGNYKELIENYKKTLVNLAAEEVYTICYNFMPILDWIRTDLYYELPNGARALYFEMKALAAFDIFILKREGAEESYTADILEKARLYYTSMSSDEIDRLKRTILDNLPGAEVGYTLEEFQKVLSTYDEIDRSKLEEHLRLFLNEILSTAEEVGCFMAIHPDDPPFSILGLPRIMSSTNDIERILANNASPNNGITFCTGSLGVKKANNLLEIIDRFSSHIHFVHLRSTKRDSEGNFFEANHLEGDVPMYEVIKKLLTIQNNRNLVLPMRPDHGHQLLTDLNIKTNPGYSAIGRLKGLAELRGVMYSLRHK